MTPQLHTPGLYFSVGARPPEPSPLRSDVAGFAGRTRRGEVGRAVRVEGWRAFVGEFGDLDACAFTTYALRGYFENGGEVAYVVRLCGAGAQTAFWTWKPVTLNEQKLPAPDSPRAFEWTEYRVEATSPGRWAADLKVSISYRAAGVSSEPEVDFVVKPPREPVEYMTALSPVALDQQVNERSRFIRLTRAGEPVLPGPTAVGPRHFKWEFVLSWAGGGGSETPGAPDYLEALRTLGDEPEVALVALPDLHTDLSNADEVNEILSTAINQAEGLRDRLVLVDLPTDGESRAEALNGAMKSVEWVGRLREQEGDKKRLRAAAAYHPRLWVPDPLGGVGRPLRSVPPSGHIAGVISRLDRERGSHHTPANAPLYEAVDTTRAFDDGAQGVLNSQGINLLRCTPGRGLQVWGGRTLYREEVYGSEADRSSSFVAHRRLVHRLVRAIRRVAEPLVFDTNGPELWLAFVRAVTTVLLEAFRGGALKGARADEAFSVKCDEETNPPEERDLGRVVCLISLAPAAPMEFITLRITLGGDKTLEVFES